MSLNPIRLKLYKVEDPIVKVSNQRHYAVHKGAQEIFYSPFNVSGQATLTTNSFNCNPTNRKTIIERKLYSLWSFTLNFNGTIATTGQGLLQPLYDAPRAYPISMCTQNLDVKIGDNSVATPLNTYWSALERYSFEKDLADHDFGMFPSYPDQFCDYANKYAGVAGGFAKPNYGASNSELNNYTANPFVCPRGFQATGAIDATHPAVNANMQNAWCTVTQAISTADTQAGTARVDMIVCEPLFISPLHFGKGCKSGIVGIETMVVNLQLDGNCRRLWSHSPQSPNTIDPVSGLVVTVNSAFILTKQLTPDITYELSEYIPYDYSVVGIYSSPELSLAHVVGAGNIKQFNSGTITLNSIPSRVYVYCRETDNTIQGNFTKTDTFMALPEGVGQFNLRLGTRSLLSSATREDLYEMAVRNGCNLSWDQWTIDVGSVLAIDFGKDVGLMPNESSGLLARSTLVITANFQNTHANDVIASMYILTIEEGTFSIMDGHSQKSVGILTEKDITDAKNAEEIPYRDARNVYGSGFFDDVWSGIKKVGNFVKDEVVPIAKDAYGIYKTITGKGSAGQGVAQGMSGGRQPRMSSRAKIDSDIAKNSAMQEGGRMRRRGGELVGGRMINRSDM